MRYRISYPSAFNLLILSGVLGTIVLLSSSLFAARAHAQTGDLPCMPPAYAPRQTVRLTDRIPESATTVTPSVFYTFVVTVTINSDDRICLSSSSNGRAPLQVDDRLDLQVTRADGSTAKWMYNFYDPATDGITTTTARDISGLFTTRENQVAVLLSDLKPHRFSAEPLWLVIWKDPTATPIANPMPIVIGTPTPALTATATPMITPSPIATWTPYPTYTPLPTYTPVRLAPWTNPAISPEDENLHLAIIFAIIAIALLFLTIILIWWLGKLGLRVLAWCAFLLGDLFKWINKGWSESIYLAGQKIIASHGKSRTEEIVSDMAKAWLKRLDLWQGQIDKQREIILEGAREGKEIELEGLAQVLKLRWVNNYEWAVEEILTLVNSGCQPELFLSLSKPGVPASISGNEEKIKKIGQIRMACDKAYISLKADYKSNEVASNTDELLNLLKSLLASGNP